MKRKKKKNPESRPSEFNKWSTDIKKRDNYTCQDCGSKNKKYLQAHHIKSWSEFPHLRYELSNGITLCTKCHAKHHPKIRKMILGKQIKKIKGINTMFKLLK